MNNKGLLAVIAVLLLGIFTIMIIQMNEQTPAERIASDFGEVTEEFKDEIDDRT